MSLTLSVASILCRTPKITQQTASHMCWYIFIKHFFKTYLKNREFTMRFEILLQGLYDIFANQKNTNRVPCVLHLHAAVLIVLEFHKKAFCVENSAGRVFDQVLFRIIFVV